MTEDIDNDSLPQLTDKQHKYVAGKLKGLSNADAYREAYNAHNMPPNQVWTRAGELASNSKVVEWLEYARREAVAQLVDSTKYTQEAYIDELTSVISMALDARQYSTAITAIQAKGKTCGHISEQSTTTHIHKADKSMLDRIEQTMGVEARQHAEQSMGIAPTKH